jgi:hypothetical protein
VKLNGVVARALDKCLNDILSSLEENVPDSVLVDVWVDIWNNVRDNVEYRVVNDVKSIVENDLKIPERMSIGVLRSALNSVKEALRLAP